MDKILSLKLEVNHALDEIAVDKEHGLGLLDDAIYELKKFLKETQGDSV